MSKNRIRASGLSILGLAALTAVLDLGTMGTATADPAIVIKDGGSCGMPGSDANGNITFGGIGQVTTVVENGNKVMLKCKGEGIFNGSGKGQSFKEFGCGIFPPSGGFVGTTDSSATVSASGVGTLTCTYDKTP
jgi:hypothetical protein